MQPHQQRVVEEKRELDEKLEKLKAFIKSSPVFGKLDLAERGRLEHQQIAMQQYSNILAARIEAFIN